MCVLYLCVKSMATPSSQQPKKGWAAYALEQKVGLVIFGVTGVVGLILSMVFIVQGIRAPFIVSYSGDRFTTTSERNAEEIQKQKTTDTDGDGINDYDELNVFRTSPYLADSDSDGFDDNQEIKSGNDPNCPVDQNCGRASDAGVNNPLIASDLTDKLPFEESGLNTQINDAGDVENLLGQLTNDDIRAALLQQGIDQTTIDALSDAEIRDLFNSALQELAASGAINDILKQAKQ